MRILLIVYDNGSLIHQFPMGCAAIAAHLEKNHDVSIYSQDIHHYAEAHLTEYLNTHTYDIVGLGFVAGYYQFRKALAISQAINESPNRPFYILGGHGPTPEPAYFLKKFNADAVVMGEGEETITQLVSAIEHKTSFAPIQGLAYKNKDQQVIINPRRAPIAQIDELCFPAYHKFPIEHYRLMRHPHITNQEFSFPMLTGRGCPFKCNFCYRMDEGYRPRSVDKILEEMTFLQKKYQISYFYFADELFMSSKKRTLALCQGIIESGIKIKFSCQGRLNYADPATLHIMKDAGCVFINYGIESFDDNSLKLMGKGLTTKQIVHGVEATLATGISPGLNMIFGNIGDTADTLKKSVDFLIKYDDQAQLRTIRPVTPYPGSALYHEAIKRGLLKDCKDFYEIKHTNSDLLTVNFTSMTDNEIYASLKEANQRLVGNYYQKNIANMQSQIDSLYTAKDATFRGFRQT